MTTPRSRAARAPRRSLGPIPKPWSAALGVVADGVAGEPPSLVHPVRLFGVSMQHLERVLYRDTRAAGVVHAAVGTGLGVVAGAAVRSTTAATYVAVAGRALRAAAMDIGEALSSSDLDRARAMLPTLAGRDPTDLDAGEVARAVVESVAENTVDAVVAPAVWAAAAGAPGALGYRAVNTLDAMVGHKDDRWRRFGWASARMDDVAAFVPARLTAVLVASVRPRATAAIWRSVRIQSPSHPSPNAGVAEAAFAAALGLRLGGANRYGDQTESRPALGGGRPAEAGDIVRAADLSRDVTIALVGLLAGAGLLVEMSRRSSTRRQRR